jgi:hypothetical protein
MFADLSLRRLLKFNFYSLGFSKSRNPIGKEKITMDFAIFAIAFNIGKMWNMDQKRKKKDKNNRKKRFCLILLVAYRTKQPSIWLQRDAILENSTRNCAA